MILLEPCASYICDIVRCKRISSTDSSVLKASQSFRNSDLQIFTLDPYTKSHRKNRGSFVLLFAVVELDIVAENPVPIFAIKMKSDQSELFPVKSMSDRNEKRSM